MSVHPARITLLPGLLFAMLPLGATRAADSTVSADRALEEIVVSARKREETSQATPVVVTVMSEKELSRYNASDMTKIAEMTPQLLISSGSNGNGGTITLRGIGSSSTSSGFDQAVSINIDGIQYSRATVLHQGYFDVAQVEVLKGPQSLFFGKSSSAGVISLTTADPGTTQEMKFQVGNEFEADERWGSAIWSGPLSDAVGLRVATRYSESDGYIKNTAPATVDLADGSSIPAPDKDWPGNEQLMARVTLTYEPVEALDVKLKLNYTNSESGGYSPGTVLIDCDATGSAQLAPGQPCGRRYRVAQTGTSRSIAAAEPSFDGEDGDMYAKYEAYSAGLNLDYRFGALQLTSVTGFYEFDDEYLGDYDFTATPLITGMENPNEKGWSQELRLLSDFAAPVNFMLGAYYQDRTFKFKSDSRLNGTVPADFMTGRYVTWERRSKTEGEAWSVFGQLTWKPIDTVEVSGGARYSEEDKDSYSVHTYLSPYFAPPFLPFPIPTGLFRPVGVPLTAKTHDSNVSPEFTVAWKPGDLMLYASYKKGFKSGGYSNSAILSFATVADDATFDPETADGFEVGLKSKWLNDTLQLNVAAYTYKFKDLQVNFFDAAQINFVTQNAASAKTEGAEAELRWLPPVDGLDLRATLAYNKAKYDKFLSFCYAGQAYEDGCNLDRYGAIMPLTTGGTHQSLSGTVRPLAPEVTASLGFSYRMPVGGGFLTLNADTSYTDRYLLNPLGRQIYQPSYVRTDASISFAPASERWEVALVGRNLSDEFLIYDAGDSPATGAGTGQTRAATVLADQVGVVGRPREVALQATVKF